MRKKNAYSKEFIEFMQDVGAAMKKQGITDAVIIYGLKGEIRNTYIPLEGEKHVYCAISDTFNEWLLSKGAEKADHK